MNGIHIYPNSQSMIQGAAERMVRIIAETLQAQGAAHVALSGGTTPKPLYILLASAAFRDAIDWTHVHVYFGDERCVPPEDQQSNYRLAMETLLASVDIPSNQIHRIQGEIEPGLAADRYQQLLTGQLPVADDGIAQFDLILLGVGVDGHTASLFPGTPILNEQQKYVGAVYVEKLASWRVSLTLPVINHARHIMFLATGEAKADVIWCYYVRECDQQPMPVQLIEPRDSVEWFVDQPAARLIPPGQQS